MIKRTLIALMVCLLLCPCSFARNKITLWGVGAEKVTGLKLGYQVIDSLELGGLTYWDEDNDFTEALGLYGNYTLPGEFNSSQISWLPDGIETINYLGIQGTVDVDGNDEDSGFIGPVFGVVLNKFIVPTSSEIFSTIAEVQYINYYGDLEDRVDDGEEVRFMLGFKSEF